MTVPDALMTAVGENRGTAAADRLCEACVELFAIDAAAISLVVDGVSTGTLGVSDSDARIYDDLQFTFGEGPCLASVQAREPVLVVDLAATGEARWPLFGPALLAHEIRAVFALPVLVAGECVGALDLFRRQPGPLAGGDLAGALVAAELAEMPLLDVLGENLLGADPGDAPSFPDSPDWDELSTITRAEVSQATGMLVSQLGVDPTEALVRLRAHAYAAGRSTSEVARDILERRLRLDEK